MPVVGTDTPHPPSPAPGGPTPHRVIVVAAAHGVPQALRQILEPLPTDLPATVLVVQTRLMSEVAALARWLDRVAPIEVSVAIDGAPATQGVFIAPDRTHLGISAEGRLQCRSGPRIGGLLPSPDYLFWSASRACGPHLLAVVLRGAGPLTATGLESVRKRGGYIIAQDGWEAAPDAHRRGVPPPTPDEVVPLDQISRSILRWTGVEPLESWNRRRAH